MTYADRIADIVKRLDWVTSTLSEDGIECSEVALAAAELTQMRLEIERRSGVSASAAIVYKPLEGRLYTFRVEVGDTVLGYLRWSEDAVFIARTTGSAAAAASVRRFGSREQAAKWLLEAVDGVVPRRRTAP